MENSSEKNDSASNIDEESVHYTPLTVLVDKDNNGLAPPKYDITQKIIIIYGLAALLKKNYEDDSTKVNITPNYVFVDDNFEPYIDIEKLNSDSQNQNIDDFVFFNAKYKSYLPPEMIENPESWSADQDSKMKADVYIFGSLVFSIMTQTIIDDDTDIFRVLDDSCRVENLFSPEIQNLIDSCWSEPLKRPTFSSILFIITSQLFISSIDRFDAERFLQYQKKVVDEKFIVEIKTNFDPTTIPNVKLYERSDFKIIKKSINRGGCGILSKAKNINTDEDIAFKEIIQLNTNEDRMRIYREIEILACTNHYAIQKLYGYIKGNESLKAKTVILTLFQKNGSLQNLINNKYSTLDFTQKYIIMYGIVSGLYYLHERHIVHRDLKPENVLMTDDIEPLITDFGLSKKTKDQGSGSQPLDAFVNTTSLKGTPVYMSPELFDAPMDCFFALFDAKLSDVYAFAHILYYIFVGSHPWSNLQAHKIQGMVLNSQRPNIPDDMPHLLRLLIEACWAQEPTDRPSFEFILRVVGNPIFIHNLGCEIDKKRFKKYQDKVLIDSFIQDEIIGSISGSSSSGCRSNKTNFIINGVKFPKIPEKFSYLNTEFELTPDQEKIANPFFNIQKVEMTNKKGKIYYQNEIKDEYLRDVDVTWHLSTQIKVMLDVNHPTLNKLEGIANLPPKILYKRNAHSIYEIFPNTDNRPPAIITTFYKNGNLLTNKYNLSTTQKFIILYGIAAGMYYLHKKGMTHLNLKPENILLNDNFEPVIKIDLTSRPKPLKDNLFYLLPIFSFPYVAPELLNFKNCRSSDVKEKSADVYSFAMVAYFLFTGLHPWDSSRGFQSIVLKTMKGQRPIITGLVPHPFDKLIESCWQTDPTQRLSFKMILKYVGSSNFIKSIKFLDIENFREYQSKVVPEEFIHPNPPGSIRNRDEFELLKIIGAGTFGNVNLARDKTNNNHVAYKEIPNIQKGFIKNEREVLMKVNFPSVIQIYGFIEPETGKEKNVILYPYVENQSVDSMIKKEIQKSTPSKWDYTQKCIVMYGVARGMLKLHSLSIVHKDLKTSNILLSDDFEPLITDFGLSKFVNPNQSMYQTMSIGPSFYLSPEEFLKGDNPDQSEPIDEQLSDVYSFGMLVFYLMTGMQPWSVTGNQIEMMNKVVKGERPTIPEFIPQKMKDLITECWSAEPSERPTFQEIVEKTSDSSFYQNDHSSFNSKRFYNYQLKLGESEFIKFSEDEISEFQKGNDEDSNSISSPNTSPAEILKKMAEKGDAQSQYRLGCMLKDGKILNQDLEKAAECFKKAADQDYLDGIIAYAICLKEGNGVEANKAEAFRLIQAAIDKGSIDSLVILASWYSNDFPRRYGLAFNYLKKAAEKGHPDAPALIGSLIERKKLHTVSPKEKVMEYYKESCHMGSYEGMYHMATFYHYGIGVEQNLSEAARLYNLVANNQNQNANQNPAIFSLTILYEEIGDNETAFKLADYYRDKKMFVGYLRCAEFYQQGIGVAVDEEKAEEFLEIAKKRRFRYEQIQVALLYSRAKGVAKNKEKSLFWTKVAAENGSSHAQANLSHYYLKNGPELKLAEEWGLKSADAGNQRGMWNLSRVYEKMKNSEKEIFYLEKAANSGYERALICLGLKYKEINKNKEAIDVFEKAADKELPLGIFYYGLELFSGKLIKKNVQKGLDMINSAADVGCRAAIEKMISIYSKGEEGVNVNTDIAKKYKVILKQLPKHPKH